ncbi:LOW QUALITY PROTEIN: hypothetical protein HID58_011561, partial [Brassica napus]
REKADLVGPGVRPARARACRRRTQSPSGFIAFLVSLLRIPSTLALSELWLRPNPWCMATRRWEGVSAVERRLVFKIKVRFREEETLIAPSSSVFSGRWRLSLLLFREGEACIALPSPYSFRRVEATVALRCRLGTRRNIGCLEVKGWFGFCSCRLGEKGDTSVEFFEEDKPLRGSSPTREVVVLTKARYVRLSFRWGIIGDEGCVLRVFEIRRNQGVVRWPWRRFEAEKIRSRRVATRVVPRMLPRVSATCFLDALLRPASFGSDWCGPQAFIKC